MTRSEWVRRLVLNEFCDDDEDIERISKATDYAAMCGVVVSRDEIIQKLGELVELGYATAWDAVPREPDPPKEYRGMPVVEDITPRDPCFVATSEGREFYKSRSYSTPLYWNGRLHKDWVAPEASSPPLDLIRILILASIWDHYTIMEFIQMRVDDVAERYGMTIYREEIIRALGELIGLGYAKAAQIDRGDPPRDYDGMPPVQDLQPHKAYFHITPAGMQFHLAESSWWPFDEDDKLREDWIPPQD